MCAPVLNPLLCLTYGLAVGDEVDHEEADGGGHGRHNHRLHHLQPGPRHVPERTWELNHHSLTKEVEIYISLKTEVRGLLNKFILSLTSFWRMKYR